MLVKTELKEQVTTKMQYEAHVMPPPTPPESYCGASDEKLLLEEQEQEGELELLLEKGCRAGGQPVIEAYDLTCSTTPPPGGVLPPATVGAGAVPRKARIGKSMAREMVYAAQQHQQQQQPKLATAVTETGTGTDAPAPAPELPFVLKAEIKAETKIKIEQDGEAPAQATGTHISQLPDLKPTIKTEPEPEPEQEQDLEQATAPAPEKQKEKERNGAVAKVEQEPNQKKEEQPEVRLEEDQEPAPMDQEEEEAGLAPAVAASASSSGGGKKRLNLMASTSASALAGGAAKKATKHQSYKSLIKQAEPKNYLCPGRKFVRRHGRAPAKYAKRRQQLLVQRQQRLRLQQQQRRRQEREAVANAPEPAPVPEEVIKPLDSAAEEPQTTPSASPKRARPRKQEIAALHLLDTAHSRGYFSDPELNHSSRNQAATAAATAAAAAAAAYATPASLVAAHQPTAGEKRSKSETKKPVAEAAAPPAAKKPRKQPAAKATKAKGKGKGRKTSAEEDEGPEAAGVLPESGSPAQETNNNEYQTADLQAQKVAEATATAPAPAVVAEDGTAAGGQQHSEEEQPKFRMPSQQVPPPARHNPAATKRTRSRSKFGNRKRQKQRAGGVSYELDETQPPATKANVVPKWNNGWMWAGKPFQGAVFLNSDDPLVLRTCYPAMRHREGDIIRTRDCVLLKANEDNELPYVAKVAHLWENHEDGEMMMSLLWYYRPEHTDQGRQRNDCPDEVYASRHRDHNSVACIEDKCYVLTFSEYCRYRRRLRAAEEDVEDVSIVPRRPSTTTTTAPCYPVRTVPDHTNPELVMFCRRAYEFRTRRLLKLPQKNGLVSNYS